MTLARATATELLEACADRSFAASAAAIRRWIAAQGDPEVAAQALRTVAVRGGDLAVLAFHALGFVGSAAAPVVRGLVDSPVKGLALVWLAEQGIEDPADAPPELRVAMLLRTFTRDLDPDGAEALVSQLQELGPEVRQAHWVQGLVASDAPRVDEVLATVGRWHPSRVVSNAARTALFRRKGLRPAR